MFYNLHTTWQLILLAVGLAVFAALSWRWPKLGAWLIIFLAPLYLLKIGNWPLTVLEALIWVFVGVWIIRKVKNYYKIRENKSLPASLYEREVQILDSRLRGNDKCAAGMTRKGAVRTAKSKLFWPVLLILAGVFIATIFSPDLKIGLGILKSWFLAPIIFAFILGDVFKDGGLKEIFSAMFASAAAVAAISFIYLVLGRLTYDGRLAAFYLSPNHLAMWLVPGIIAGLGLWFGANPPTPLCVRGGEKKSCFVRGDKGRLMLFAIGYSLLAIALYSTYSYGAWLGLAVATVFALFYFWQLKLISKSQLFLVSCFLFLVFVSILFLQLSGGNNAKLTTLLTSPRSSWQSRLMVWQSAIKILKDHWLIGIGPGLFQQYYLAYQKFFPPYLEWAAPQPHNLFLAWWLQTGLLGLAGFIWLVWNFFRCAFNFLIETKRPSALIPMAIMVYFLVHGLADTTFWKNDLSLIFWVIAFLGYRASRRAC